MTEPRVEVLVTEGCHLCDQARAVVAPVCGDLGIDWRVTDLTAVDPATRARWREFVPVVMVDGKVHDVFRVDADRLHAALRAAP